MSSRSPAPGASPLRQSVDLSRDDTVIRRRVPSHTDTESLLSQTLGAKLIEEIKND